MAYDYMAIIWSLLCFRYQYGNIIHSRYEVVSLLPFLSEKHICVLFLLKHFVLLECIDIKQY